MADRSESRRQPRLHVAVDAEHGQALAIAAVRRGLALAVDLRDEGVLSVCQHTDGLSRQELVATVVALAAMLPADTDPDVALAWVDLDAADWPDGVVRREAARAEAGARDGVALLGLDQARRRRAALLEQEVRGVSALRRGRTG